MLLSLVKKKNGIRRKYLPFSRINPKVVAHIVAKKQDSFWGYMLSTLNFSNMRSIYYGPDFDVHEQQKRIFGVKQDRLIVSTKNSDMAAEKFVQTQLLRGFRICSQKSHRCTQSSGVAETRFFTFVATGSFFLRRKGRYDRTDFRNEIYTLNREET